MIYSDHTQATTVREVDKRRRDYDTVRVLRITRDIACDCCSTAEEFTERHIDDIGPIVI